MKWIVLLLGLPAAAIAAEPQAGVLADCGSPATLRAAIRDLMGDFGPEYPAGEEFLRRLDAIEQQMASGADSARAANAVDATTPATSMLHENAAKISVRLHPVSAAIGAASTAGA